ncbi:hypothetical protein PN462_02400 [Spirulina sp. CS-785/01]|uniref:hypothetical protein n=1 Tax=Spirulina sp. CS-785/01 TaxID=3021716 RepID=UPI0023306730|nr:hypothetical protein [Spirulina sp. CS-785/01]MDB9311938.1 hypothetical protein [Spirulina sp. CS-785/01]
MQITQPLKQLGLLTGTVILGLSTPLAAQTPDTPDTQTPYRVAQGTANPYRWTNPETVLDPASGQVNIKLTNSTGIDIQYQVRGQTERRSLSEVSSEMLNNLDTPTNLTFVRPDGGFINAIPRATATPGQLELVLVEADHMAREDLAVQINEQGEVFVN